MKKKKRKVKKYLISSNSGSSSPLKVKWSVYSFI